MSCRLQLIDDLSYEDVKKCYRGSVSPAPHMIARTPDLVSLETTFLQQPHLFRENLDLCRGSDLRRWRSSSSLVLSPQSLVSLLCGVRR